MSSNQSFKKSWDINPVITPFVQDYKQQAFIGGDILPDADGGDGEWIRVPTFSKDRVVIHSADRAIGAPSNSIQLGKLSWTDLVLAEYDLQVPLDYRLMQNRAFNAQLRASLTAAEGVALWKEKVIADLVMTASNYPTTNYRSSTNSPLAILWDQVNEATFQFGQANSLGTVVKTAAQVIRSAHGVYPNAIAMGAQVWDKAISINPELVALVRQTVPRMPVEDDLKSLFRWCKKISIGTGTYFVPTAIDSDGLFTGSFVDLWGNDFLLYYNPLLDGANADQLAPALGYTFVKNGFPVADDYDPGTGGKIRNFRVTKIQKSAILGNTLGFLFKAVLTV